MPDNSGLNGRYKGNKLTIRMKKIQIINGPNLNLLGKREPTVYGNASFEDYLSELRAAFLSVRYLIIKVMWKER